MGAFLFGVFFRQVSFFCSCWISFVLLHLRAMILINEWLPNPAGNDAQGEWVELFNSGSSSVSLDGWIIKTGGGSTSLTTGTRKYNLKGTIGAGGSTQLTTSEYLILKRTDTKLVLRNTDEKVFLYDAKGNLIDQSGFLGSAPEGKSFSRSALRSLGEGGQSFAWSEPTPGATNRISLNTNILHNAYPVGISLNKNLGVVEFWSMLLGAAVVLTAIVMFVLKRNESLFKLFFRGDEEIR